MAEIWMKNGRLDKITAEIFGKSREGDGGKGSADLRGRIGKEGKHGKGRTPLWTPDKGQGFPFFEEGEMARCGKHEMTDPAEILSRVLEY